MSSVNWAPVSPKDIETLTSPEALTNAVAVSPTQMPVLPIWSALKLGLLLVIHFPTVNLLPTNGEASHTKRKPVILNPRGGDRRSIVQSSAPETEMRPRSALLVARMPSPATQASALRLADAGGR
jgi:hypothetical protein